MSLNNKYISVKTIVAKLYRDLKLTEEEDFVDIIEWCAEALDFIHVYPQYESKSLDLSINNYKTELPCDFISIEAMYYEGQSVTYSSNIFGPQDTSKKHIYLTPYSYNQKKIENVLLLDPLTTHYVGGSSFKFENGFIKTSFNKGDISIRYLAMIMDEEGYPMVPDNQSFKEALYWYCVYKYLYPKYLSNKIPARAYEDAYIKWQWYCNQSGAEALMPDLVSLENIKRAFISMRPNINRFNNFFNSLNKNY